MTCYRLIPTLLTWLGRLVSRVALRLTVTGREHLPAEGPLLIVSNHFSWFEAPLIALLTPYRHSFLAAIEFGDHWFGPPIQAFWDIIPVYRGRVDRRALRQACQRLDEGGVLVVFPEGGVDPAVRDFVNRGHRAEAITAQRSRLDARLIPPRPGAGYLAGRSGAPILPIAFLGTEKILDNLRRLRRTAVEMRIGPVFGPVTLDPELRGPARRAALVTIGDELMRHLAHLLPPANRGPYQGGDPWA